MDHRQLLPLVERLDARGVRYALGGSGLLRYLNLIQSVNDWDLTVECSKVELLEAIHGFDYKEQPSGDPPFASEYRLSLPSLNVDIIGGFAIYSGKGVVKLPIRRMSVWDGVHVSHPEVWYVAYRLMDRGTKGDMLFQYLQSNKRLVNQDLVHELLAADHLDPFLRNELNDLSLPAE
ncbi:hypothetical protein [Paenibacillus sp. JJ-223]|uniref:hypothetical protein n=1 Tax=Paenibacillus sp. JJ-223 TaxID=2905647 RepID=UPI001F2E109D|nr:hypothetical protein [Paenibacillus sp. JJ-223]CAH1198885.1 hypothetical protein PAECIP111890_01397 [Paenibacillus sp. JJ-223]